MDARSRMRSRSVRGRFWTESVQKMSFWCRKRAIRRQFHVFRDRIPRWVAAAQAWAAWRDSHCCGWAARRTAGLRISGWRRLRPGRCALGAGFGRSVQSRSTWSAARERYTGSCAHAARADTAPGWVRVQPCSIARFGVSCRGRRERICGTAVVGARWSVAGGQWSVASCQLPVVRYCWNSVGGTGDELEPRTHSGIHLPVAGAQAGDAQARWHRYRGALRGVSPRTREGRNGPTVQRQRPVASGLLSVVGGRGQQGVGKTRLVPEEWEPVPHYLG